MNITRLYEALDELEVQARMLNDEFASDGDLSALYTALNNLGEQAFQIFRGIGTIQSALKFED